MQTLSIVVAAIKLLSPVDGEQPILLLGTPFADNAVLQRDRPVPVWGTALPNEGVAVQFAGQEKETTADGAGRWRVTLDPLAASAEGRALTVCSAMRDTCVMVTNVVVGEVWFASGQSNMECFLWAGGWTRYRDRKGAMMTAMTRLPNVRYAKCPVTGCATARVYRATWHPMTQKELARNRVSAIAFYYARELYLALGVPIGIVDASIGGTNIDSWTPRCGYEGCDASLREEAQWQYISDRNHPLFQRKGNARKAIDGIHQQPSALFNGMVAAWTPMAMRGLIWYQGCHNALRNDTDRYAAKMHAFYNGWSRAFANPSLRLYFAELAPYGGGWLELINQQHRFVAEEPNAAIAVLSDAGNRWDIHPNDKETVAQRLAVIALKRDYGFDIPEDTSPVFRSATVGTNGIVTLAFDHAKSWYVYADDYSKTVAFELAGTNGVWRAAKILNYRSKPKGGWADEYMIDSPDLVIRSDGLAAPTQVRYMAGGKYGTLYADSSLPLGAFSAPIK